MDTLTRCLITICVITNMTEIFAIYILPLIQQEPGWFLEKNLLNVNVDEPEMPTLTVLAEIWWVVAACCGVGMPPVFKQVHKKNNT